MWRAGSGDVVLDFRGGTIDELRFNDRPVPATVENGQVSSEALAVVDQFLAERSKLPIDLRRKILLARDELERTVKIRNVIRG